LERSNSYTCIFFNDFIIYFEFTLNKLTHLTSRFSSFFFILSKSICVQKIRIPIFILRATNYDHQIRIGHHWVCILWRPTATRLPMEPPIRVVFAGFSTLTFAVGFTWQTTKHGARQRFFRRWTCIKYGGGNREEEQQERCREEEPSIL